MRARERERGARGARVAPSRFRPHASRGSSSVEYGLLIAVVGVLVCLGIGYSVRSMFQSTLQCFMANLQGVTAEGCASGGGTPGGGGGGTGTVGPAVSPAPAPARTPTPTATPTPTPTPTASPTP